MNSITNNSWTLDLKIKYNNLKSKGILEKEVFNCAKCEDRGYTFNEDNEVIWCECKLKKDEEERLKKSGLVDRVKNNNFKNYKQEHKNINLGVQRKKAVNTCLEYLKKFREDKPSIVFMGQVGAGKTHLAIATANKLLSKYSVKYVLYEDIKKLKFKLTDREYIEKQLLIYKNAPILFIDDLFKDLDKVTDFDKKKTEIEVAYEIINYRYNQKKPMIITTELDVNRLIKVDEAIASRILEVSKGYWVTFNGLELNYRIFGE